MTTSVRSTSRRLSPTLPSAPAAFAGPVFIGLLGGFRLLKAGNPITLRNADKTRNLLCRLALQDHFSVSRERLLHTLWPASPNGSAGQSLNSLIYSLHKLLGDALDGAPPVIYADGYYHLNVEAGITIDVAHFDTLVRDGTRQARAGQQSAAMKIYEQAVALYRGDLCTVSDIQSLMVCEALRAQYLHVLAELSDYYCAQQDYTNCLVYAQRLLASDPCREDAHRLIMRCHMRQGQRAQALHQYRVCENILQAEFDVTPEAATVQLYEQIRLNPDRV
jgi:DNA-binding SARP family transcriptional activator